MPRLAIDVEARLASFEQGIKRVEQTTAGMAGRLESAFGGVRTALAALGGVVAVGQITSMVRTFIDAADALDDLAQKSGVAVESLSELQYAANIEGIGLDSLGDSFTKLSVNLQAGARGSKELQAAFSAVGISAKELSTIGADEAFRRIATAFEDAADGPEKAAVAVQLFGRAGADMIPLLNYGADGLRRAGDEARRFGLVVSSETARAAAEFNDNLVRLQASSQGVGYALGNSLLGPLGEIASAMATTAREGSILLTVLRGLAEAGKVSLFGANGDAVQQQRKYIQEIRGEIVTLQKELSGKNALGDGLLGRFVFGDPEEQRRKLAELKITLADAEKALANLQKQASANPGAQVRDKARLALPVATDDGLAAQLERGTQRAADFALKIYTDQFAEIRRQAAELQADLVSTLRQGPEEAQRQAIARRSALDGILGQTQIGRVQELQGLLEELARAGAQAPLEMQEQYEQAFEIINQRMQELNGNLGGAFDGLSDEGQKAFDTLIDAVNGFGREFTREFSDMVLAGEADIQRLGRSFARMLLESTIQKFVVQPGQTAIANALGSIFASSTAGGGATGAGSPFVPAYGGGRAVGGPVSGGKWYTVGERGPESLFVPPGASGYVVPNGGMAPSVTINQYIDSRTDLSSLAAISRATERRIYDTLARR